MSTPAAPHRIVLLTEGHGEPLAGKTASCLLRYRAPEIVAILDSTQAGRTADDLRPAYPHFDDFVAVRDRLDPHRVFTNPYLDRVLGA